MSKALNVPLHSNRKRIAAHDPGKVQTCEPYRKPLIRRKPEGSTKFLKTYLQYSFLLLALLVPTVSPAQTAANAPLSQKAQAAVEKGITEAQQSQWDAAIRNFNEAHQLAPDSALPLLNLGLAEAQLSGHELRAICWFEAYLSLLPNAVNAPAVRQQIENLKVRVADNLGRLIAMLKVLAAKVPASDYWGTFDTSPTIAGLLASSGDLDAAEKWVQQSDDKLKNRAREQIVEALVGRKHISEAVQEVDHFVGTDADTEKTNAYKSICEGQIAAGLFADATHSIELVYESYRLDEQRSLIEVEYKMGHRGDAAAMLGAARAAIDKESNMDLRETHLLSLAETEYKIGLHEEADAIFQQVKSYVDGLTGKDKDSHRLYTLTSLALYEDRTGHRAAALEIMKEAEKAGVAADKAQESPVSIISNGVFLWYIYLNGIEDYKRAEDMLRHVFSGDYQRVHSKQIAAWRADAIATAAAQAPRDVQIASARTLADVASSPAQRTNAWLKYLHAALSAPLHTTDFQATLARLAEFTPAADDNRKAVSIFDHLRQPAQELIDSLNNINAMERTQPHETARI